MDRRSILGQNIRILRGLFGETQDDLADALHVAKTTVSSYETGDRQPPLETVDNIAKHFGISVEELTNSNLSFMKDFRINIDYSIFWKNIDVIFPFVIDDESTKNAHFKEAYYSHMALFEGFRKSNMDAFDKIENIIDEYSKAYEGNCSRLATAANMSGLILLLLCKPRAGEYLSSNSAALKQVASSDKKVRNIIENFDSNYAKEFKKTDITKHINSFEKCMFELKHSREYSDLADYYLALRYIYGPVYNELDNEYNQRIGNEMLSVFASVGNEYAIGYQQFFVNSYCR